MGKIAVINDIHRVGVTLEAWMLDDLGFQVYLAGPSFRPLLPVHHLRPSCDPPIAGIMEVHKMPPDALFVDTHPLAEKGLRSHGLKNPVLLMWMMPVGPEWVRENFKPGRNVGSLAFSTSVGREIAQMSVCPNDHFWPPYPEALGQPGRGAPGDFLLTVVENAAGWSNVGVLDLLRKDSRTKLELYGGGPPDWSLKIPKHELWKRMRESLAMYHLKPFDTPGLAVMEAALQGVPIIFPPDWIRTTQAGDVFQDGASCLVVPTEPERVFLAVARLRDPAWNAAIGAEGKRRLMAASDWEKNRPRLVRLVEGIYAGHVVQGPAPPPAASGPASSTLAELVRLARELPSMPDTRPQWLKPLVDEPIERTLYYRFLFEYAKRRRPAVMIETGTFRGHSAAHLAAGNPEGRVVTIDHDPEAAARVRAMNLANVTPVTGDSLAVFHNVRDLVPEVDLLFLDSSMKFPHAHEEREAYSTLVRPGCPILLDDIFINPDMEKTWSLVPPEKAEANGLHYKGFGISVKSVAPGEP